MNELIMKRVEVEAVLDALQIGDIEEAINFLIKKLEETKDDTDK